MESSKIDNLRKILLLTAAVVAVFFSLYKLSESPSVWYDEGWYVQDAANIAVRGADGLQLTPGVVTHLAVTTVGYPLLYPMALWMRIFGTGILSARSLMALFILGLIIAAYFLAKRLYGPWMALGAVALLATFPPLFANGKSVLGEVPGMFYLLLCLIFLNLALGRPSRRKLFLLLSGLALGLCVATKPEFLIMLPAVAIGLLIELRRKRIDWKDIFLCAVFTLVPIILWLLIQFGGSDSLSGILTYYANPYHEKNLVATVIRNFTGMFKDPSTLYTLLIMAVWAVGLWLRQRAKKAVPAEEIISFIFSILIIGAFLRTAGIYRYLFPAQILALIFFPYSLNLFLQTISVKVNLSPSARKAVPVLLGILAFLGLYQCAFHSWVSDTYHSHKTAYWEDYFAHLDPRTSVFFYNTPEVVPFIHGDDYYQYLTPAAGPIGALGLEQIKAGKVDRIIIVAEGYKSDDPLFKLYDATTTPYKYDILFKKKK